MQFQIFNTPTKKGSITGSDIPQCEEDIIACYGKEFVNPGPTRYKYRFTDQSGKRYGFAWADYAVTVYGYITNSIILGKIEATGRVDEFGASSLFPILTNKF